MMAGCDSEDNAFKYPPLFQDMRLTTTGGPLYRGGRGGRATAAYYREREAVIAAKNKYGRRFGRRLPAYKPDCDSWKSMRESFGTGSHTFEFTPGGLQERKYSVQAELNSLTRNTARKDQQDTISLKCHTSDKTATLINKYLTGSTISLNASNFQTPEVKKPSQGGRGVMRGKRMIDVATVSSITGEKTDKPANLEKREPRRPARTDDKNTKDGVSNRFPSQLIKLVETMSIH